MVWAQVLAQMGEQRLLYSLYRLLSSHWEALTPVWLPSSADWWRNLQCWRAAGQVMMKEKEIGPDQDEEKHYLQRTPVQSLAELGQHTILYTVYEKWNKQIFKKNKRKRGNRSRRSFVMGNLRELLLSLLRIQIFLSESLVFCEGFAWITSESLTRAIRSRRSFVKSKSANSIPNPPFCVSVLCS